jgi:hypothetical protein
VSDAFLISAAGSRIVFIAVCVVLLSKRCFPRFVFIFDFDFLLFTCLILWACARNLYSPIQFFASAIILLYASCFSFKQDFLLFAFVYNLFLFGQAHLDYRLSTELVTRKSVLCVKGVLQQFNADQGMLIFSVGYFTFSIFPVPFNFPLGHYASFSFFPLICIASLFSTSSCINIYFLQLRIQYCVSVFICCVLDTLHSHYITHWTGNPSNSSTEPCTEACNCDLMVNVC